MSKRVLLTGAGGFVGHHTLEHLLVNTDWEIVCTDSFRHRGTTDRISEVLDGRASERNRVSVITHDLVAPISSVMKDKIGHIDYIISMASDSHVDRSITDPRPFIENNVALVLTLLDYARDTDVEKFIQVSTDEVYGPAEAGYAHVEWDPMIPSNPYAASKAAQEAICTSYWRTFNVPVILTNTMNIIGERQDVEKFMPMVISRVLNGENVTIHGNPGKIGSRFYLHARNQADALLFLLENFKPAMYNAGASRPSRFHVVGEREVDNLEMAKMIAAAVGKPLNFEFVDFHATRPGHDLRYALNGKKLTSAGWSPKMPLETSIEHTVAWTLEHPEWLKA